jgi:hypothetical protein
MTQAPRRPAGQQQSFWLWILCLIGLDYFSSLAYQPSIAVEVAGQAAPLATLAVVLVTLCGALPVYFYVAGRSPHGEGEVALLEQSFKGWRGKLIVLVLLGFSATDFIITRTVSAADAAVHLLANPAPPWQEVLARLSTVDEHVKNLSPSPLWHRLVGYWNQQLVVTVLLSILGFAFWAAFRKGFTRRLVQVSVVVVAVYLMLNAVVIGAGLTYLSNHEELVHRWWEGIFEGRTLGVSAELPSAYRLTALALLCLVAFPQMSLGLSGFELSMVVMPLIRGDRTDDPARPVGRIRNARILLFVAGCIMSLFLLGSSLVTTLLIPAEALGAGPAHNRALAYLAHGGMLADGQLGSALGPWFGTWFGTIYDFSTVVILCLAGASIGIGLRDLVPEYLHRLGMALQWAHRVGIILHAFNLVNLAVTVVFRASVTEQRGAYATSVLTLISSAAWAAGVDRWRKRAGAWPRRFPWFFAMTAVLFLCSAVAASATQPGGLLIALCFVLVTLVFSVVSRYFRHMELRLEEFDFKDAESKFLWESLRFLAFPILVPHRPGRGTLTAKEEAIRCRHRLAPDIPLVFVEAHVGDASNFFHRPLVEVIQEDGRFILRIERCVSIAHVLAAVALEMSRDSVPPEIHFGWSSENPISANLSFLLFGEGNVPWMVRELIARAEPDPAKRPAVVIG